MVEDPEVFTKFGKFVVSQDNEVYGELRIAGKETLLYLRDDELFHPFAPPDGCITGTLHDLTKVTLLECIILSGLGSCTYNGERYYYANLFPHFVLEGRRHITPSERTISQITFVIDDATALFYDFDAFGVVIDSVPYIEQIVAANKLDRPIQVGSESKIVYFTGKRDIIEVDTVFGRFRARHNPRWSLPGPRGVRIDNIISVTLEISDPIAFDDAITRTLRLLRFLGLIIGRPQTLKELIVFINAGEHLEPLKVHWSHRPARDVSSVEGERLPQPADLLLNPIHRQDEFIRVMRSWLEKDEERQDARLRFHTSLVHQQRYSVERLIGAANMFDILPESAAPKDVELPKDLQNAKQECRDIFKPLPDSYERNSVLGALGRVGKASLKHKAKHRAEYIVNTIGERFPDMVFVLDAAIDCRNHYVHGSDSKIDYSSNFNMVNFFTDTLEFVYGASELIEAGWDIRTFVETPTSMTHPYGAYRVNYQLNLQTLKQLVDRK
jgi:hypothetical protein